MNEFEPKTCRACGRVYTTPEDFFQGTSRWRICDKQHLWYNCSCHSTNIILKNKYSWYRPGHGLTGEASSLFNQFADANLLPHIPSRVMEMQQLLQDPNATSKQLAEVAKSEPMIASNVLKIANNLKASTGTKIHSLDHAIAYVGLGAVNDIVLTACIQTFPLPTRIFQSEAFWARSLLCGRIAEHLHSHFKDTLSSDEIYLAATLCNIGKVVGAFYYPIQTDRVEREIREPATMTTWQDAEKRHRLADHTILGEIGATMWGLPEYILDACRHHHHLGMEVTNHRTLIDYARFANQLTHWVELEPQRIDQQHLSESRQRFGLSMKEVESLAESLLELKRTA